MGKKRGEQASKNGTAGRCIDESTSSRVRCQSEQRAYYIHGRCFNHLTYDGVFYLQVRAVEKKGVSPSPSLSSYPSSLYMFIISSSRSLLFCTLGHAHALRQGYARHKRKEMVWIGLERKTRHTPADGQMPCTHAAPTDLATFPSAADLGRLCSFIVNLAGPGCLLSPLFACLPACLPASDNDSNLRSACTAPHTRTTLGPTDRSVRGSHLFLPLPPMASGATEWREEYLSVRITLYSSFFHPAPALFSFFVVRDLLLPQRIVGRPVAAVCLIKRFCSARRGTIFRDIFRDVRVG
ncbi:uncharacterized protein J3D65DRAFT_110432 [Phyllosticta citribraziliensis]|uniref:Uncharacterized protein n=1 Tax=Phyllosticta citribraziliensis TaxID=989973 RepID=A0ABR1LBV0_9PEZI